MASTRTLASRLFSYVILIDDGAAPSPFWGTCTLAIGEPQVKPAQALEACGCQVVRKETC